MGGACRVSKAAEGTPDAVAAAMLASTSEWQVFWAGTQEAGVGHLCGKRGLRRCQLHAAAVACSLYHPNAQLAPACMAATVNAHLWAAADDGKALPQRPLFLLLLLGRLGAAALGVDCAVVAHTPPAEARRAWQNDLVYTSHLPTSAHTVEPDVDAPSMQLVSQPSRC